MSRALTTLGFCLSLFLPRGSIADEPAYQVIVNANNPLQSAERGYLSDVFLKKTTRWSDGVAIRPVDLSTHSDARAVFSREVVGRTVSVVKSYWQQVIFSGRGLPPPEFKEEADIVHYVSENPGAVGYVSASTRLTGVRILVVK